VLTTLTLDPGFSALGWGIIQREHANDTVVEMDVIKTKPASKKKRILANEDNFMRGRQICEKLVMLVRHYEVDIITFEAFSLPRKASVINAVKIGMPYGMIIMLSVFPDLAVVMSTPQHIKKANCGRINASKDEVRDVILERFHDHPGVIAFTQTVAPSDQNHGWDALAAYTAAEHSDVMKALKTRA
jgi:Holliday junction resolvasome RuvABC endonuclease subunit